MTNIDDPKQKLTPKDFNIIIPLGGSGAAFREEGYILPKPLVRVLGHPIIFWVLDCIPKEYHSSIFIGYNPAFNEFDFELIVSKYYSKVKVIDLKKETCGPVETIVKILEAIPPERQSLPFISFDGDTFYTTNVVEDYINAYSKFVRCGAVYCFEEPGPVSHVRTVSEVQVETEEESSLVPQYSYIKTNEEGRITDIAEKKRIGKLANSGVYCFADGSDYLQLAKPFLEEFHANKTSGVAFVSAIIQKMIDEQKKLFLARIVDCSNIHNLGTPMHVRIFANNVPAHSALSGIATVTIPKKRFCFDLDDTLVTSPIVAGDYTSVKPIPHRIALLRKLKAMGHYIIIQTARRMKTHSSNVGRIMADVGRVTMDNLENFGIPYDELYFGKPFADFYIDDKAILACTEGLERELGFYTLTVAERDFHSLQGTVDHVTKHATGEGVNLEGEIHWYKNVPAEVLDCFPFLIESSEDNKSMTLERILGYTVSALYTKKEMKSDLAKHIVGTLRRIHRAKPLVQVPSQANLYENYSSKLVGRYKKYTKYAQYPDVEKVYKQLLDFCTSYEEKQRGICGLIHGDPVLTNILVNRYGKLKFIDMRGKLGSVVTQFGDTNYDFAKLLQSFCGYDNILHGESINPLYRKEMISVLKKEIMAVGCDEERWNDIRMIVCTLLFTLIPLHDNEKCAEYYNLIQFVLNEVA